MFAFFIFTALIAWSLLLGAGWCHFFTLLSEDRKPVLAYATMLDGRPATLMARVYEIRRSWDVTI